MTRATRWILALAFPATLASGASAARTPQAASDPPLSARKDASGSPRVAVKKPIARLWRGRTLAAKADEYEAYLFASGIARIRETPGNLGVTVLRRADGSETEFLVISTWESIAAVKRFAGKDYQKAVILDRDREYLLEVEPNVRHYEIAKEERNR